MMPRRHFFRALVGIAPALAVPASSATSHRAVLAQDQHDGDPLFACSRCHGMLFQTGFGTTQHGYFLPLNEHVVACLQCGAIYHRAVGETWQGMG